MPSARLREQRRPLPWLELHSEGEPRPQASGLANAVPAKACNRRGAGRALYRSLDPPPCPRPGRCPHVEDRLKPLSPCLFLILGIKETCRKSVRIHTVLHTYTLPCCENPWL